MGGRERTSRGVGAEGDPGSSRSRELNLGLDPRTPESQPSLKADALPAELPRYPGEVTFKMKER